MGRVCLHASSASRGDFSPVESHWGGDARLLTGSQVPDHQLVALVPVASLEEVEGFAGAVALPPGPQGLRLVDPRRGHAQLLRQEGLLVPGLRQLQQLAMAAQQLPHGPFPHSGEGRGGK